MAENDPLEAVRKLGQKVEETFAQIGLRLELFAPIPSLHPEYGQPDRVQCQPAGTMVEVVTKPQAGSSPTETSPLPIEMLKVGMHVASWDSTRYYDRITEIKARPYFGRLLIVEAAGHISRYTPDHRCIVDPSPSVGRFVVYVMRRGEHYRVGQCSWAYGHGTGIRTRAMQEGADAAWVLADYPTKRDALIAEGALAGHFGLPMITFNPVNSGTGLDGDALDAIWDGVGPNKDRAKALLDAFGRSIDLPLWRPISTGSDRLAARRIQTIHAANLLDGWLVALADGRREPIQIGVEHHEGQVWSMNVANRATYFADGIATHNCIFTCDWEEIGKDEEVRKTEAERQRTNVQFAQMREEAQAAAIREQLAARMQTGASIFDALHEADDAAAAEVAKKHPEEGDPCPNCGDGHLLLKVGLAIVCQDCDFFRQAES